MTAQEVGIASAFWVLAVIIVGSALAVVFLQDLFRAALALVVTFLAVAGLYVLLQADFLAAVQVLIYAGAIAILLIFAVMLSPDVQRGGLFNRYAAPLLLVSASLLVALILAVVFTEWAISTEAPPESTTAGLADALFTKFVLPLEVAAVLLLAAILGAITLGREE